MSYINFKMIGEVKERAEQAFLEYFRNHYGNGTQCINGYMVYFPVGNRFLSKYDVDDMKGSGKIGFVGGHTEEFTIFHQCGDMTDAYKKYRDSYNRLGLQPTKGFWCRVDWERGKGFMTLDINAFGLDMHDLG